MNEDEVATRVAVAVVILSAFFSLAFLGLAGWALIELVQWVTSK